jgi:sugar phosphate isomerase/epimerase
MALQIGINADSSTINGNLTVLDGLLGRFGEVGFTDAEIPVHGVDCILNGAPAAERFRDTAKILKKHPLSYTVHGPDALNLAAPDMPEIHASALRAAVDFAAEIEAKVLVYHGSRMDGLSAGRIAPGGFGPGDVRRRWREEIDRLGSAAAYAERRGVKIAVENIFRQDPGEISYRSDPRELAAVIEAVGTSALGICFDFGHAHISSREEGFDYFEALRAVLPRLCHVHIHDNFGRSVREGTKTIDAMFLGAGDLHLPPGRGTIPYEKIFPLFAPRYRGVYMLELQPRFSDRYEESLAWVRRMAEALK